MEDCVKRIIDLCADKGVSRGRLCRDIGIPPTTFSNYVIRGGKPTHDVLKKISSYFGVSMEYLDTGIDPTFNIESEVRELVSRIAALPPQKQEQVLSMMYRTLGMAE